MDFARLQLRTTIDEARDAIWNLRQTDGDAGGLGEKLESMTRQVSDEFHLPVDCSTHGTPFGVSHPVAHDLLMVAREGIFNAALHGHPARVQVGAHLHEPRTIAVARPTTAAASIRSRPRPQNGHHFGLRGMRERIERSGGKFKLTTAIGKGVQIEVRLPRKASGSELIRMQFE